jgi:DNA-binding CsgD family transcriptional regulator
LNPPRPLLTPRELEVLRLICGGTVRNRDLAIILVVSEFTVEYHVKRLLSKMDSRSRAELVVRAHSSGVLGAA